MIGEQPRQKWTTRREQLDRLRRAGLSADIGYQDGVVGVYLWQNRTMPYATGTTEIEAVDNAIQRTRKDWATQ